jgi:predicted P-loop ATPase
MTDFCMGLDKVRLDMLKETFGDFEQPETGQLPEWMSGLELDKTGVPKQTSKNFDLILTNDPQLKGKVGEDLFAHRTVLKEQLPWRDKSTGVYWTDADESYLMGYVENRYKVYHAGKIRQALDRAAADNAFHPVKEYLESVKWDGLPRVDRLLIDFLGAPDDAYTKIVTRKWLCAAVARIYQPGIKFDNVLMLVGEQGIGKSLLGAKLAGEWFNDSLHTVEGKDALELLQGSWILEMAEMIPTRKVEVEAVKQFISKQEDTYRAAYGRNTTTHKRQCVFLGTTNDDNVLKDKTGNRRFWPVDCDRVRATMNVWDMADGYALQVWAEALTLWKAGETLHLTSEQSTLATEQQVKHTDDDGLRGIIEEYLERPITQNWYEVEPIYRVGMLGGTLETNTVQRDKVCVREVWVEALRSADRPLRVIDRKAIANALDSIDGWGRYQGNTDQNMRFGKGYGVQRAWVRKVVT